MTVPATGAAGVSGWVFIVTLNDDPETQPRPLVTVKVYVPGASPATVVLVPDPVVVCPPGVRVMIQSPEAGRLFSITLPVGKAQVG